MSQGRTHDVLPPAASRMVGDVLRSPGKALFPDGPRLAAAPPIAEAQLPVALPAETAESEARQAESALPDASPIFNRDFSNVRVHTDAKAAQSAQALGARAYTVGSHVVFGPGEFNPAHESGRRLLAHELVHTQQPGSERRLARKVEGYEAAPTMISRPAIEKLVGTNYWSEKIDVENSVTQGGGADLRLKADPEEHDAVYSVASQYLKQWAGKSGEAVVSIPARPTAPKSKQLAYKFSFTPAPDKSQKPNLLMTFIGEDAKAAVTAASAPAAGFSAPASLPGGSTNVPGGKATYFKAHPNEYQQLANWIDKAPAKFDQIVTTNESGAGGKKHESSFHVIGAKDASSKVTSLDLELLAETATDIQNPPPGYANKDHMDIELETIQARAKDKLGALHGLDSLPVDEQLSVKFVIWQYFNNGTRNKEVDAIVPIAKKSANVFYTLRFQPVSNDVDIERVGEEGAGVRLKSTILNIGRVEGFAANASTAAAFSAWIKTRYPSITTSGTTLTDLQDSVNKDMEANAGTPAWFKTNYGMEVLNATAAETAMKTEQGRGAAETAGLKAFQPDELKRLEFALETMNDVELKLLRGTKVARQPVLLKADGSADPHSGITWQNGSKRLVIIADSAHANDAQLFLGGAEGVRMASVGTYAHELGHIIGAQGGLETAFNAFVKNHKPPIQPVTKYAASLPATESFPEAFALYQTDPEWMRNNLPDLFQWFETQVKQTGKPAANPAAKP